MYYICIFFFFEFFIEARSQPGTPLFNLKIIISVCDTHEIRTYNKGQHQKLIRRFMFSCIRATHTRLSLEEELQRDCLSCTAGNCIEKGCRRAVVYRKVA